MGNLCTIDRGVTDSTIIGAGSILDNQIQMGHDTVIGKKFLSLLKPVLQVVVLSKTKLPFGDK